MQQDAGVGRAERARRLHELLLAQREHLAADDARDVGPVDERDDRDDRRGTRAGSRPLTQPRTPQAAPRPRPSSRTGKESTTSIVRESSVSTQPAVEAGEQADDGADQRRRSRCRACRPRARRARRRSRARRRRDRAGRRRRDARRSGPSGLPKASVALGFWTYGPGNAGELDDQRCGDRDEQQQHDEAERDEREAVAAKAPPEELARRARGDATTLARDRADRRGPRAD